MPAAASEVRASDGPHTHTPKALTHTATAARRTEGVNILDEYYISINLIEVLDECAMTARTEQQ